MLSFSYACEINRIKPTQKQQVREYLENKTSFLDEIKNIFHSF